MYMHEDRFRGMLAYLLQSLRLMEHELVAHQALVRELCKSTEIGTELERILCELRSSPALLTHLRAKYDTALETLSVVAQAETAHQD